MRTCGGSADVNQGVSGTADCWSAIRVMFSGKSRVEARSGQVPCYLVVVGFFVGL